MFYGAVLPASVTCTSDDRIVYVEVEPLNLCPVPSGFILTWLGDVGWNDEIGQLALDI